MDSEFGSLLMRAILTKLDGDRDSPGLRDAVLKCSSFDQYREMCGRITAYLDVISMMSETAKRMNARE